MSQNGLTARRFYHDFHQWTTLPARFHTRCLAKGYRDYHPRNYHAAIHRPTQSRAKQAATGPSKVVLGTRSYQTWLDEPLISPRQRPFGSLKADEHVVRSRNGFNLIIELGVTESKLRALQEEYGEELDDLSSQYNTRVGIAGSAVQQELDELTVRSLMISGTNKHVTRVIEIIKQAQDDGKNAGRSADESTRVSKKRPHKLATRTQRLQWMLADASKIRDADDLVRSHFDALKNTVKDCGCKIVLADKEIIITGTDEGVLTAGKTISDAVQQLASAQGIRIHWRERTGIMHLDGAWQDLSLNPEDLFGDQNARLVDNTRSMLSKLTHPVVVVSAYGPLQPGGDPGPAGATVSSFTSITLDPAPFVSFNLKADSRTWAIVQNSRKFRVHVFDASPESAAIAHEFTQHYQDPATPFENVLGADSVQLRQPKGGPKMFVPSLMYMLNCKPYLPKCTYVGDHVIVVAMVYDAFTPGVRDYADIPALTYGDRTYREPGVAIRSSPPAGMAESTARKGVGSSIPGSSRSFSTMTARRADLSFDYNRTLKNESEPDWSKYVTDADLLSCTVTEFFGVPKGLRFVKHRRMRDLVNWKKAADHASRVLQRKEADGSLTARVREELEGVKGENYDRMDRALALRSAYDLRMMLDRGSIDARLSPWLEQALERGQVVVVEERERLHSAHKMGFITEDAFRIEDAALAKELEELEEVSGRLRAAIEDEAE